MKRLNNRGDTIVEALIATVIIGLTIALAYGIATRSLRSAQQAQERLEALKLAEGQIEAMKALTSDDGNNPLVFGNGSSMFCFDGSTRHRLTTPPVPSPNLNQDNLQDYGNCVSGPDNRYKIAVRSTNNVGGNSNRYQFTVTVRWFRLGGQQKEEVKILYRLHPQ